MFLIDTNVISEARKRDRADPGVAAFFRQAAKTDAALYLSAVTVGELRRGVALIGHRGDGAQARLLDTWLRQVLGQFSARILPFDTEAAQVWGALRVPHPEHALDKQIAAIALVNDLILVTRNTADFVGTGVKLSNPFAQAGVRP